MPKDFLLFLSFCLRKNIFCSFWWQKKFYCKFLQPKNSQRTVIATVYVKDKQTVKIYTLITVRDNQRIFHAKFLSVLGSYFFCNCRKYFMELTMMIADMKFNYIFFIAWRVNWLENLWALIEIYVRVDGACFVDNL